MAVTPALVKGDRRQRWGNAFRLWGQLAWSTRSKQESLSQTRWKSRTNTQSYRLTSIHNSHTHISHTHMHIHHRIMMIIKWQEGKCQRCFMSEMNLHLCAPHTIPRRSEGHATGSKLHEATSQDCRLEKGCLCSPDRSGLLFVCLFCFLQLWFSSLALPFCVNAVP